MRASAYTPSHKINSIAIIGNYLPRKCGIATFTTDLVRSLSAHHYRCKTVAINDKPEGYLYPEEVLFEINQDSLSDYNTAARFLNINEVDLVLLQHEFGIFGGSSGDYILSLLADLNMPVVTTLHTVLTDPTKKQLRVMKRLTDLTDRFVVMSNNAIDILNTLYDIPREKISYIPHGIPDIPFVDPNYYKEQFGFLGKNVLLTFGLLSENKGIEYVIKGLPKVIERFPDLIYIVLGATHPNVLEYEGERYRRYLEKLTRELGLKDHVLFKNDFVSFEELCEYLSATDLYITPYIHEEQITSGTLAYAAGTGKAIISTPYWYAKEMLAEERGRFVPFKNEDALASAILELFENDTIRHQMRKRSYDFNRNATWEEVARQYTRIFYEIKSDHNQHPRPNNATGNGQFPARSSRLNLPALKFNRLKLLTDDTGLLQHAKFSVADRDHGYCTDDNARALIVAMRAMHLPQISEAEAAYLGTMANRYLGFLLHAYNENTGRFRNFMGYSRQWLEDSAGSEDSHGRALWALGVTVSMANERSDMTLASTLFMRALNTAENMQSPRAIAFTILGINAYLETFTGDSKARNICSVLAEKLYSQFFSHATKEWPWFEDTATYSNAKLPQSLILAGRILKRDDMITMGLRTLKWLLNIQTENGHLAPIGNRGWYNRNTAKARFDQQPVEANTLLEACITAYDETGNDDWMKQAELCFSWFLGNNDLHLSLYNHQTGGCRDGLQIDSINQNEGAESTLSWLLSLTAMHLHNEYDISVSSKKVTHIKLKN